MEGLTEFQPKTIAHTLFLDFVGYSRLPAAAQAQVQQALHNLTYETSPMKRAPDVLTKNTGDGLMLAFFDEIETPLQVAAELDEKIKRQQTRLREQIGGTQFRVRMGVHSGPVIILNESGSRDVAGEGINIAQRVMDAGDAEHILISDVVAQALSGDARWKSLFDDLGMCRVKHDELVHLHNVHGFREDGTPIGNEALPPKVRMTQETVAQLIERDAERAREGEREIARGFFSRIALIVGIFAAVVALGVILTKSVSQFTKETSKGRTTGQKVRQAIKEKQNAAKNVKTGPEAPTDDASPAAPSPAPDENGGTAGKTGLVGGADAQIPDLKGLDQSAATEKLAAQGLKLALSQRTPERPDPSAPKGQIVAQFPAAGTRAGGDATVYVTLSSGAEGGAAEQGAASGVVVDVRSLSGFMANSNATIADPSGQPLNVRFQFATDEAQATQLAGGSPLKVWPAGSSSGGGVLLSAEDITKLQALPAEAQGKIVVLHR